MSQEPQELTGPDLRAGVRVEDVAVGRPLLAHVDGEPVLLYRTSDGFTAVGALCTHYGGPLHEGVVSEDVVRCPWHHACFSLRTGEAVAAPALNPLPQWRTEMRDGVVRAVEKIEHDALAARGRSADGPASIVIIGAGAAGSAAAEMVRREGYTGPVTLIDPDPDAPYDRPNLSKDYLAGNAPEEWIPLRPQGFYEERDIRRITAAARSIDPSSRTVVLANGESIPFGALLIATGAEPLRPPIPGASLPHVHVLRSLADCRKLIEAVTSVRHVVIAGASFIGMEAAASLRARGLDVTVVAPEQVPFTKTLGDELGALLREEHERCGVKFRLGRMMREIGDQVVVLDDNSVLDADIVLLGVGVRPLLDLAKSAGLAGDRGVPVDACLETPVRGIFAAGDIAQFPDARTGRPTRVEHWVVAQRQGQVAARNMLGHAEPFTSAPFFWTNQFDVAVRYVGHATEWDEVRVSGDVNARDCAIEYLKDDMMLATATVNRDRAALEAELAIEAASTGALHAQIS